MLTYLATYRLKPLDGSPPSPSSRPPLVAVRIADFCLHHAAARAEWRRPTVAAQQGWHPGRTELVAVELLAAPEQHTADRRSRARRTALQLVGCPEEADRLLMAAAVVAGADH